jgi:hypothetical protein
MGVNVSHAALYSLIIETTNPYDGTTQTVSTNILLTEFITGEALDSDTLLTKSVKSRVQSGAAADIAIGNFDVCGDNMANILFGKDVEDRRTAGSPSASVSKSSRSKKTAWRVDVGNCFRFGATGERQPAPYSCAVEEVMKDINQFLYDQDKLSANVCRVKAFEGILTGQLYEQARNIVRDLGFAEGIKNWFADKKCCSLPMAQWQSDFEILLRRLDLLADFEETTLIPEGDFWVPPGERAIPKTRKVLPS